LTVYYKDLGYSHREAQEVALLTLYGDFIDLFRSSNTEDLDFKPLALSANLDPYDKKKVRPINKLCPTN